MKKRTGPRSFMDLGTVRESGGPVRRKTDRSSQTLIKCCGMTDYLVLSQMSLLSLDKLREVDLMLDSLRPEDILGLAQSRNIMNVYTNFDSRLLRQMSR